MSTAAKRAGSQFEVDVLHWLRSRGMTAERLAKAGSLDEGDLVMTADDLTVVFELKVRRSKTDQLSLGTFMAEAVKEAENYSTARSLAVPAIPAVLIKRSNKPLDETFVLLRLRDFVQ